MGLAVRFYVYELVNPLTGVTFYVGKGSGDRVADHEAEARKGRAGAKCDMIRQIWSSEAQVGRTIVRRFATEAEAYEFEVERIAHHGIINLTNIATGGRGGVHKPRCPWIGPDGQALMDRAMMLLRGGRVVACGVDITADVEWLVSDIAATRAV